MQPSFTTCYKMLFNYTKKCLMNLYTNSLDLKNQLIYLKVYGLKAKKGS